MILLEENEKEYIRIINDTIIVNGVKYNYGERDRRILITNTQSGVTLDLKFDKDKHHDPWYNKHQEDWYREAANAIVQQWGQVSAHNNIIIIVHNISYGVSER